MPDPEDSSRDLGPRKGIPPGGGTLEWAADVGWEPALGAVVEAGNDRRFPSVVFTRFASLLKFVLCEIGVQADLGETKSA